MIQPVLRDEAFLDDVRKASEEPSALNLWWLGQSGFLVQWHGLHLLLDPYLSDLLTHKYANTDKPHVRMTERVVAPERLDFISAATSSHNHTDHLDAATLQPLMRANPELRLVIPEANREFVAQRLGCPRDWPVGLDDGLSAEVAGTLFTGVASAHEQVDRDAGGRCHYLGYIVRIGPWSIYHSGDTVLYSGMVERLRRFGPDVALLPINGADPTRRVAGNLNGREAAALARNIGAGLAVPCHYEMFEFNTASPGEFEAAAWEIGQPYRIVRAGERLSLQG